MNNMTNQFNCLTLKQGFVILRHWNVHWSRYFFERWTMDLEKLTRFCTYVAVWCISQKMFYICKTVNVLICSNSWEKINRLDCLWHLCSILCLFAIFIFKTLRSSAWIFLSVWQGWARLGSLEMKLKKKCWDNFEVDRENCGDVE